MRLHKAVDELTLKKLIDEEVADLEKNGLINSDESIRFQESLNELRRKIIQSRLNVITTIY